MRLSDLELIGVGVTAFVLFVWAGDWLMPACAVTLWACLRLTQTHDRLYVLPAAIAFQWSQTQSGRLLQRVHGTQAAGDQRQRLSADGPDRARLCAGARRWRARRPEDRGKRPTLSEARPDFAFTFPPLIAAYVGERARRRDALAIAPSYPSLRQIITTFDTARLGVLFLIMRRSVQPDAAMGHARAASSASRSSWASPGSSPGSASRSCSAVLAVLEVFDRRNKQHWVAVGGGRCRRQRARTGVDGHPQRLPPRVRRDGQVPDVAQRPRGARRRPDVRILQERPTDVWADRRLARRPDVDRLLSGAGDRARAERPAAHRTAPSSATRSSTSSRRACSSPTSLS